MAGKILIVDGVATNRIVLKVKLSGARYETIQAASGAEALALLPRERPDLILLDAQLPDVDGIELCRTLKSSAEWKKLKKDTGRIWANGLPSMISATRPSAR